MRSHLLITAACAALSLSAAAALAQANMPSTPSAMHAGDTMNVTNEDFVTKAAIGNMFEVESSRIALQKSGNAQVKTFAEKMVKDHTDAGEDMGGAVEKSGLKLTVPAKLDAKHMEMITRLKDATTAEEFNKMYVNIQLKAHEDAVALFTSYAKNGQNPALKSFATETLPTLREHEAHVQDIKL
jgi:putative membrane protein